MRKHIQIDLKFQLQILNSKLRTLNCELWTLIFEDGSNVQVKLLCFYIKWKVTTLNIITFILTDLFTSFILSILPSITSKILFYRQIFSFITRHFFPPSVRPSVAFLCQFIYIKESNAQRKCKVFVRKI